MCNASRKKSYYAELVLGATARIVHGNNCAGFQAGKSGITAFVVGSHVPQFLLKKLKCHNCCLESWFGKLI